MSETFTCENCGKTFPKGWTDEEAAAEAEELFPGLDASDPAEAGVVCDECYERIMARVRAEAPELIGPGWRGEAASDPIGDALRADAEAASAEIRAAGIICPSCDVNMADLPDGHRLAVIPGLKDGFAECRDGRRADITAFESLQMAANVSLWDAFRRREAEAFRAIVGEGPADFTGLLSVLQGEDPH
jgi:DNA-directed RNA polymerase subunit RPC12/RpoP